jgi:hypothetical protein
MAVIGATGATAAATRRHRGRRPPTTSRADTGVVTILAAEHASCDPAPGDTMHPPWTILGPATPALRSDSSPAALVAVGPHTAPLTPPSSAVRGTPLGALLALQAAADCRCRRRPLPILPNGALPCSVGSPAGARRIPSVSLLCGHTSMHAAAGHLRPGRH